MKNITDFKEFDGHEAVLFAHDRPSGLRAFIVIHNTNIGPATGGTRYAAYVSEEDALREALRLSRAMTYKCALAGVRHGGGKGVIIANPKADRRKIFAAYAQAVNRLGGWFTTGEDVGVGEHDIAAMRKYSRFVNGRRGQAGDLGPWAARGVFKAMLSAAAVVFGSADLLGKTVAVKGLGKVGLNLCKLLSAAGANIVAADVSREAVIVARRSIPGIQIVPTARIHRERLDIYGPCAMGGEFTTKTAKEVRASIICGGANNQLATPEVDAAFRRRGVVYVPDYVANAGGLIAVAGELDARGWSRKRVARKIENIGTTVHKILLVSERTRRPTGAVADAMARAVFED